MKYYYRVEHKRLNRGQPVTIRSGMYEGCLEFHVVRDGIDQPDAIPIRVAREIPWDKERRGNILNGTLVTVGLQGGEATYKVECDYGTCDSQCLVVKPWKGRKSAGD